MVRRHVLLRSSRQTEDLHVRPVLITLRWEDPMEPERLDVAYTFGLSFRQLPDISRGALSGIYIPDSFHDKFGVSINGGSPIVSTLIDDPERLVLRCR